MVWKMLYGSRTVFYNELPSAFDQYMFEGNNFLKYVIYFKVSFYDYTGLE